MKLAALLFLVGTASAGSSAERQLLFGINPEQGEQGGSGGEQRRFLPNFNVFGYEVNFTPTLPPDIAAEVNFKPATITVGYDDDYNLQGGFSVGGEGSGASAQVSAKGATDFKVAGKVQLAGVDAYVEVDSSSNGFAASFALGANFNTDFCKVDFSSAFSASDCIEKLLEAIDSLNSPWLNTPGLCNRDKISTCADESQVLVDDVELPPCPGSLNAPREVLKMIVEASKEEACSGTQQTASGVWISVTATRGISASLKALSKETMTLTDPDGNDVDFVVSGVEFAPAGGAGLFLGGMAENQEWADDGEIFDNAILIQGSIAAGDYGGVLQLVLAGGREGLAEALRGDEGAEQGLDMQQRVEMMRERSFNDYLKDMDQKHKDAVDAFYGMVVEADPEFSLPKPKLPDHISNPDFSLHSPPSLPKPEMPDSNPNPSLPKPPKPQGGKKRGNGKGKGKGKRKPGFV
jgi:hypothetical protein